MKYIIKNNEVGFLFNKQVFQKLLGVGEYITLSKKKNILVVNKKQALESYGIEVKSLDNNQELIKRTTTFQVKEHEVAFHFINLLLVEVLTAGTYTYLNDTYIHTFTIHDTRDINIPDTIDFSIIESRKFQEKNSQLGIVSSYFIDEGYVGILHVNGKFVKILNPGRYHFFTNINKVDVKYINLKNQVLQISGQELLTKDKVTLRMNFILIYKIIDSLKVATTFDKYEEQLYLLMQLALREFVSTKTLDELLAEKHEIGKIILNTVKVKEKDFGATFIEAGLKDIILPGEIKEILNTILIAEKKALANVITRREETASTRSLLNTAKLMEENMTLYKLKELEYIERICDKVGNISLSSNSGIIEQLNDIIKVTK